MNKFAIGMASFFIEVFQLLSNSTVVASVSDCIFRFVNARMRYTKRFGAKGGKRAAASLKGAGM